MEHNIKRKKHNSSKCVKFWNSACEQPLLSSPTSTLKLSAACSLGYTLQTTQTHMGTHLFMLSCKHMNIYADTCLHTENKHVSLYAIVLSNNVIILYIYCASTCIFQIIIYKGNRFCVCEYNTDVVNSI